MPPMPIVGHGIDLVEIDRIDRMLDRHGRRFIERCFTPEEIAYADAARKRRAERYAVRFAAKEAALKALGTGLRDGIRWTDIAVIREPNGRPGLAVAGRAKDLADQRGISGWRASLTHTGNQAMASVIAVSDEPTG